VFVVVVAVRGVTVAVVHVVDVITMGHRDMATSVPVGMVMSVVGLVRGYLALVIVAVVGPMNVAIMGVVDMVAVWDRDVAATLSMSVVVAGVFCMGDSHEVLASCCSLVVFGCPGQPPC
jgi:hypothetical protein